MTTTTPSPDVVKAQQRTGWGEQAQQWYAQLEVIERQWSSLSEGLLDLARVTTGDRVLDLACGAGDPALAAAARVGPAGTVIASDISPDMLAFAAQRAAAAGLANLDVHEMDAEAIDLPNGSVDVVLCRLGLMFLPNLDRALTGVHRVLVPGGRFATAIPWRPARHAVPHLVATVLEALDLPAPPPPTPGRPGIFSLADASHVCAALEHAGLADIRVVPYTLAHDYRSADEWLDFLLALNVPLRQMLSGIPETRIHHARQTATQAAQRQADPDGHIRFPGHYYYATAIRPAHASGSTA